MSKWQDDKRAGVCTLCHKDIATGPRKILCDRCKIIVAKRNEHEAVEYFDRDYSNSRPT